MASIILRAVTTQLTCPSCRATIPSGSAFCPSCGTPSPTVIANERVARDPTAAAPAAALAGVPTAERLARALGGKYEVRRLVGRGGFAEVYELWDKELDRRLACKVLHPEIAWTPGMLARFRQEAKALARLQHPAILPIHFAGDGEGLVYYVMPFVEGESLADALRRRGPYAATEAVAIAQPVLQALAHAHAQGLVHRDVKPDNVMLEAKTGRALLLDFGIAKLLGAGEGGGVGGGGGGTKTATGFTVGTVQYMSHEQALGQANLDGRSDLYAFGAMLYQMVTGAPPYDGDSSAEIVGKHLADPVPVASDVNARIPRWLSDVIVKCLAKKPEDRFASADAVLAALAAGPESQPGTLVGAATLERQVRRSGEVPWRSRGWLGWWVAGGLAALLVVAWAATSAPASRSCATRWSSRSRSCGTGHRWTRWRPMPRCGSRSRAAVRPGYGGASSGPATRRSVSRWRARCRRSGAWAAGGWRVSPPRWEARVTSRRSSPIPAYPTSRSR